MKGPDVPEDTPLTGSNAPPTVFADGSRITPGTALCVCGPRCEFPCWQRLGLTADPCCAGCAPLEAAS